MSTSATAGIDLDGTAAYIVTISGGAVESMVTVEAETSEKALSAALSNLRPGSLVKISLDDGHEQKSVSSAVKLSSEEAKQRMGMPGAYLIAEKTLENGTYMAIPGEERKISEVYTRFDDSTKIYPSSFCGSSTQGMSVSISRLSIVATFLSAAGWYRKALEVKSLDSLARALDHQSKGWDRLLNLDSGDIVAQGEMTRWANNVVAALLLARQEWINQGLDVGREITVYGQGATLPLVKQLLESAGLNVNIPAVLGWSETDAAVYYRAYQATSAGSDGAWKSVPLEQKLLSQKKRETKTSTLKFGLKIAALIAVPSLILLGLPQVGQWWVERSITKTTEDIIRGAQGGEVLRYRQKQDLDMGDNTQKMVDAGRKAQESGLTVVKVQGSEITTSSTDYNSLLTWASSVGTVISIDQQSDGSWQMLVVLS